MAPPTATGSSWDIGTNSSLLRELPDAPTRPSKGWTGANLDFRERSSHNFAPTNDIELGLRYSCSAERDAQPRLTLNSIRRVGGTPPRFQCIDHNFAHSHRSKLGPENLCSAERELQSYNQTSIRGRLGQLGPDQNPLHTYSTLDYVRTLIKIHTSSISVHRP